MKRILITGASGFIGSTLVDTALQKGWQVTAAVRPSTDKTYLQDPRIHFLELNFKDNNALKNALEKAGRFDYVIHNAGITKALKREGYFAVNTELTKNFVEILRGSNLKPAMFLLTSSLASMGPRKRNGIIKPSDKRQPVTYYGESKLAAEEYLETLSDFNWCAVQPTAVFGPRDKEFLEIINPIKMGLEFSLGTIPQQLSFIYSKDLANMMLSALEHGISGKKYLATDGNQYNNADLGNAITSVLGKKTIKIGIPLPIVKVVAYISEKIGDWREVAPMISRNKMNELAAESWICDMTETFSDLKFTPQYDLFSGMKETLEWYKTQGWIK